MASGGLRVQPHIRGHIASCNGRVELVKTQVESYPMGGDVIALDTQELQARGEESMRATVRSEEVILKKSAWGYLLL